MATKKVRVHFNPCCFCSRPIEKNNTDPCRITVENCKWKMAGVVLSWQLLPTETIRPTRGSRLIRAGTFLEPYGSIPTEY
jgi:hypothetical protein